MIISALVVTWEPGGDAAHLPTEPRLTWGPRHQQRQAVVGEASDTAAAEDLFRWLQAQPVVAFVDLVSAHYADDEESSREAS